MLHAIYRLPSVIAYAGLSKSTIYSQISLGLWTRPVSIIGKRAVGWPVREIEALSAARIAGRSDQEIRELVKKLEANRMANQ